MSFSKSLDLEFAFKRVWSDKRDDAWPDVVGYHDFRAEREAGLASLEGALGDPRLYKADLAPCLNVPKKGFTLRPAITPSLRDRIVYQAVADLLAPHFSSEAGVYSNRLAGRDSERMFQQGVELWTAFQGKVEELCQQHPWVVETDITAFYDHISHDLLFDRLREVFRDQVDLELLSACSALLGRLLPKWVTSHGLRKLAIPQVNDASSFFANVFLDELDKWLIAHKYTYVRYVDDIRLFADSESQARSALAEVIVKMRAMGLYVASAKTRIRCSQEVSSELSTERATVDQFEFAFKTRKRSEVESIVSGIEDLFFRLLANKDAFDDRLFRYCVNRMKRLKAWALGPSSFHAKACSEIIRRLWDMPYSTDVLVDYLSMFPDSEEIQRGVLEFLAGSYSIYPWQQMLLLELLIRANLSGATRACANQLACELASEGRNPACRAKALILRGKIGSYADRRDIRDLYYGSANVTVKRAIIVGIQELDKGVRDNFFANSVVDSDDYTRSTIRYVQQLSWPTYHHYEPPSFPDIIDDDSDDLYDLGSDYYA